MVSICVQQGHLQLLKPQTIAVKIAHWRRYEGILISLFTHDDTLRDADELLVHYNDRYGMHKPAAMGNFLWQMGSNNHKDRTQETDDILFFGCI